MRWRPAAFAEIEQPVGIADLMPYDEFIGTRFCREWFRQQSIVDGALEKSATSAALFIVFRHQRDGVVDDKTRRRMRLILPHMRRAVLIGKSARRP